MPGKRRIEVHLLPELVSRETLRDTVVVVIDILRATTTIVHALAAGCTAVYPVETLTQARQLACLLNGQSPILAGERDAIPIEGFEVGNSPGDFTTSLCSQRPLILTTTNGTRAIHHARFASRLLVGAFVNFSAICEELRHTEKDIHLLCAGSCGEIGLEDVLFAGGVVDYLARFDCFMLSDAARIAWDTFEHHGEVLVSALELSKAGQHLLALGFDLDLKDASCVDRFGLIPVAGEDPLRVSAAKMNLECNHFRGHNGMV